MTNGTHDVLCPPDLAPSGLGARKMAELNEHIELVEFPDIGHADLVECPQDAIRIVSDFFRAPQSAPARPRTAADPRYFSGFVPAIQMITRLNFPSASMSKKLQLCMSFFVAVVQARRCSSARWRPSRPLATTMFRISWKIETEAPQKSVNIRRISSAPEKTDMIGLHGQGRVVGEVREDRRRRPSHRPP